MESLDSWTNKPNQKLMLKFKSLSNTTFSLVNEPTQEGITFELIEDSQPDRVDIVKATITENGNYTLTVKDSITSVDQIINVTNFDRSDPKIEISGVNEQSVYGENGTSTSEMPIE